MVDRVDAVVILEPETPQEAIRPEGNAVPVMELGWLQNARNGIKKSCDWLRGNGTRPRGERN